MRIIKILLWWSSQITNSKKEFRKYPGRRIHLKNIMVRRNGVRENLTVGETEMYKRLKGEKRKKFKNP